MSTALPMALRPLRHGPYRVLATSLVLTLLGTGLFVVAVVWQVVAIGGGPGTLSVVTAAGASGLLVTALVGGVLADRVPQRRLLLASESVKTVALTVVAALSLTGTLRIWHLALVALIVGCADGLYYPAYSALLPSLIPEDDLLAANGLEGALRPMLVQAAGPAAAAALVAAWSPGAALALTAAVVGTACWCLTVLPPTPLRREVLAGQNAASALYHDLREGVTYLVRTPWLFATLVYAAVFVLLIMGPIEVLIPFVIKDQAGGGPADHALVLAAFGVGGAVGSLVVASLPLPRRYLTVMNLSWGLGCLPLAGAGASTNVTVMAAGAFLVGAAFEGGTVIWGTLLQRRVPPALLGRVSSLDFFVSLVFMPVSMAMAGVVSGTIGMTATFLVAGLAPAVLAVVVILVARMPDDELAHPLDRGRVIADAD